MEQQEITPVDLLDTASYLAVLLVLLLVVLWVFRRTFGSE